LAASIAAALWFLSASSGADATKDQCVDANTKGQDLRRDGKFSAAREQLRQCTAASCPAMVRDDCTKRLDELENAQPTIAFEVKDASGADVSTVKVSVDGQPLADRLDGTALAIDRGSHVFTFTVAGQTPLTRTFVLTEGNKGRREKIGLGALAATPLVVPPPPAVVPERMGPSAAPPGTSPSATTEPVFPDGTKGMGTQKILGLVGAGIGVAGIAVGSVFGAMGFSEKNQQTTDCRTAGCSDSDHALALNANSTGMTDSTIASVGFIAGGAMLVGGAILFFTGGHSTEKSAPSGMLLVPSVGPGGAGFVWKGEF
jgi:hypothetical protein